MEDSNILVYSEGEVYVSEFDGYITDDEGDKHHGWEGIRYINKYFKKLD